MMRVQKYFFLMLLTASSLSAQDLHLSHYDVAALYLNPASTGMYGKDGNYRFSLDQRSQWRSISAKPFLTSYLSFDMPYNLRGKKLGVGGYLINNNSGTGGLNIFTFMGSASYDIIGSSHGTGRAADKHLLSVGVQ